jgi:Holliday junction resolvase RusA-like endonuclease
VSLTFEVFGRPAPQGSKRFIGHSPKQGGRFIEASKYLPAWRKAVTTAASEAIPDDMLEPLQGPVELEVVFFLERPATISVKQRPWPIKPPDVDKLLRAVLDSCTDASIWLDDGQVVKLTGWKCYADTREPGATITIRPLFESFGLDFP